MRIRFCGKRWFDGCFYIGRLLFTVFMITLWVDLGAIAVCAADDMDMRMMYVQRIDDTDYDDMRLYPDLSFSGDWKVQNAGVRVIRQEQDGSALLRLSVRTSFNEERIVLRYNGMSRLQGNNLLVIPMIADGGNETGEYSVTVTLGLLDGTCVAEAVVDAGHWQELVVDVSDIERIETITITVNCGDVAPGTLRFAPIYFSESRAFRNISRYMTPSFGITGGKLFPTKDGYLIQPTSSTVSMEGMFVPPAPQPEGTHAYLLVTLSGKIDEGSMICGFRRDNSDQYEDLPPTAIRNGRYVYAFPFTSGDVSDYRLIFRNPLHDGDGMILESVSVLWTGDAAEAVTGLGYISSVALSENDDGTVGRVVISGSVSQKVMSEHSKDEMVLYAVPYTEALHVSETSADNPGSVELMRSKVYMNFELIPDWSLVKQYIGTHMFYVTIEGGAHGYHLLAPPKGIDYVMPETDECSVVGIAGASAVGTFESNASHVVVELPFHRLVMGIAKDSVREADRRGDQTIWITTASGTVVALNNTLLRELAAEVSFYASANIDVYLRMTAGGDSIIDGVSAVDTWGMEVCSAVLSHIFTMDGGAMQEALSGIILGEAWAYTERDLADKSMYYFTRKLAELMRVVYSTVCCHTSKSVAIILPLRMGGDCNDAVIRMLAAHTGEIGAVPWYIMSEFSTDEDGEDRFAYAIRESARILESARTYGATDGTVGSMYFFRPDPEDTSEEITLTYNDLCEIAQPYDPRVIFLSADGVSDEKKELLYRGMKNFRSDEKNSIIETIEAEIFTETTTNGSAGSGEKAVYTIWDFGNLYYTDGWIAGGTVSGCTTERSEIFSAEEDCSTRALRADVTSDNAYSMASAIVLRNFNTHSDLSTTDLSAVDDIIFRFSVGETTEPATIIFIVGNDRIRAEYTLNDVLPGRVHTVRCPLSDYSGTENVSYIGVMVYAADAAVLEIGSVQLTSRTLSAEEMAAMFAPSPVTEEMRSYAWFVIAAIIGVISVFLCAAMIRRDREDAEERGKVPHLRGRSAVIWQRKFDENGGKRE